MKLCLVYMLSDVDVRSYMYVMFGWLQWFTTRCVKHPTGYNRHCDVLLTKIAQFEHHIKIDVRRACTSVLCNNGLHNVAVGLRDTEGWLQWLTISFAKFRLIWNRRHEKVIFYPDDSNSNTLSRMYRWLTNERSLRCSIFQMSSDKFVQPQINLNQAEN